MATKGTAGQDKSSDIGKVFKSLNRKFEEDEAKRRAKQLSMPYFELTGFPIEQNALKLIPHEEAESCQAIVFLQEGPLLRMGVVDPTNKGLQALLKNLKSNQYQVELYLISQSALEIAFQQYKKIIHVTPGQSHEVLVDTGDQVTFELKSLQDMGERIATTPITKVLGTLIGAAVTMRASDIHIEPEKKLLKIRFRIDGVLQDMVYFPLSLQHNLLSRIKLLSSLKLNVTANPQDGRFSVKLKDRVIDLRVSAIPAEYGESIVMRLLGLQDVKANIEDLGLEPHALQLVIKELMKPNGMILTTGPTGSGKSTTLYAFLNYLNEPGVKIITLEDPVEYQIEGIIQTPIDQAAGMTFVGGLRSILRQDPDIIMVGEIRDLETAETASQAALTGHVVLSTLHTNDAAGAIPRLLNLGVSPVTLGPAINALMAQRLLRRICPSCKEVYKPGHEELERVKLALSQIPAKAEVKVPSNLTFYAGKGCEACHQIGYKGRIGVFELFSVGDDMEQLIYKQAPTNEIRKQAVADGMLTMQQDGILKALAGLTDLAEVWRVTEE